jgi:hypothetical protein
MKQAEECLRLSHSRVADFEKTAPKAAPLRCILGLEAKTAGSCFAALTWISP